MKAFSKLIIMLLVVSMLVVSLASCDLVDKIMGKEDDTSNTDNNEQNGDNNTDTNDGQNNNNNNDDQTGGEVTPPPFVDYVSDIKFDPNSGRNYIETTVKYYIDGDTTHFDVPKSISETGVLKARYLGINTPESTGQIEPWGKKASNFTRSKLESATSIIIESDTNTWNPDSTGERFLVWVWYKSADMTDYKNLNLEILQAGLSRGSSAADTVYGEACSKIFNQSVNHKLYVFSQDKDPDFYYGAAQPLTLKELKTNIENYANQRVAFEGVVVKEYDNSTVYVEEYDEETDTYFGMQVFYGYNLNWFGKNILQVGKRVRVAGSVQYYENGGTWQISDIKYDPYDPESKDNIAEISTGHSPAYNEVDVNTLLNGKVTVEITEVDENDNETIVTKTLDYGYVALHSTASIKNLTIKSVYTTQQGGSKGAMSITCEDENGNKIVLRTVVLTDPETQNQVTASSYPVGSKIDARGIVDYYDGEYQLKILATTDISFR